MLKFCSLFSGSSGNSLFVTDGDTRVLVDAGMSGKKIIEAVKGIGEEPEKISAVCVTHEHNDHIKGAGILSRMFDIPIFANEKTWLASEDKLGKIEPKNRRIFVTSEKFSINEMCVNTFDIPHDASEPVGFNFFSRDKKLTIATDLGHVNKYIYENITGSDFVLLESNHDVEMVRIGHYPWYLKQRILSDKGHLSNELAGKLILRLVKDGMFKFSLGHLSKDNNFPELAFQTVSNVLERNGVKVGKDVCLDVVTRDRAGQFICI